MQRRDFHTRVNGLSLHVAQWGDDAAPAVVTMHGIRGFGETFAGVAAALQPERRVIAFDQRGRGQSDWDPAHNYYTDAYVADLAAIVDSLNLDRSDLLGHSMGGINALVYAARFPERMRRMVIEDAGPGAFEGSLGATRIQEELRNTPERFNDWAAASAYMRALRPSVTEEARQQRLQSMLKALPDGGFTWQHDHVGIARTRLEPDRARVIDLAAVVPQITCPTLVIRGGRSDYLQPHMADAMAAANPRIRWREIGDAGHYVHDDQPAQFNAMVREFILGSDT